MEVEGPQKSKNTLCVGCGGHIQDQYILRVSPDLEWHASCLKCYECAEYLDESCTCFVREGKTYCKRDYSRLFGAKCTKCNQGFSKSDFVMRARNKIYHIDCFRCVACSRQLIPGDEFALRDDGLFCKADNDVVERSMNNNNSPSGENLEESKDSFSSGKSLNNNDSSKKSGDESVDVRPPQSKSSGSKKEKGHKTTRVRTVLNEKQLHTLRTCYNANPRPDALMKEQLVEMTNLSPRVIRVWFQNKRCKDKKRSIYLKQMQQQQQEKCPSPYLLQQGVPMVASSPVRHEPPPNMQPNPVEVQSYQAPWKALSEFAAMGPGGGEMDHGQAPFQQLVSAFGDSPPLPVPPSDEGDDDDDRIVTLDDSSPMSNSMTGIPMSHMALFQQRNHFNSIVHHQQHHQHHHQHHHPPESNGAAPHMIMTDLT